MRWRSPFSVSRKSALSLRMVILYSERDVNIRSGGFSRSAAMASGDSPSQTDCITWFLGAFDDQIIDHHANVAFSTSDGHGTPMECA